MVEALGAEVVIFDRRTHKAHVLSTGAAAIWRAAANGCSIDDVAEFMDGADVEERRKVAAVGALDLERAGLLTVSNPPMSRRSLVKALSGALALPTIVTVLAPTPAAAASNLANGAICVVGVDTCASPPRSCKKAPGSTQPPRCCTGPSSMDQFLDGGGPCNGNSYCCGGFCTALIGGVCVGD